MCIFISSFIQLTQMETMHKISYICSYVLNTLMHLFLIANIKKKSRISKMKNIAHIRAFMHLPHFLQDLFWDPFDAVMISTSVF